MFKQFTKFCLLKREKAYGLPINPFLLERFGETIHNNVAIHRCNMTPFIFWKRIYDHTPKTSYRDSELTKLANTLNVFGRPYLWYVFQNIGPDTHTDKDMLLYRSWIDYRSNKIQGLTIVEDLSRRYDLDILGDPSNLGRTYSGYYETINNPDWWPGYRAGTTDYNDFLYAEKIEQQIDMRGQISIKCVGLQNE